MINPLTKKFNPSGSITDTLGFRAAGVASGIKKDRQLDLSLVTSDRSAQAAGVFTQNRVQGHSLQLTRQHLSNKSARAVLINSGNANACVGQDGLRDAQKLAEQMASRLRCPVHEVLLGSTGVIGKRLDLTRLHQGIDNAYARLAASHEAGLDAARAIMTTDTKLKSCSLRLTRDQKTMTIAGMAKGSGMIHPNMATMIAVLTTDCVLSEGRLPLLLKRAVDPTFNRISVDGDTSVCDMVLLLANGASRADPLLADSEEENAFLEGLTDVCRYLARSVAADGEGATKLIDIQVEGARNASDAYRIVNTVARSPLVKTMFFGEDANWGRVITAVGYSGALFHPERCDLYFNNLKICSNGSAVSFDEDKAKTILRQKEIQVRIVLAEGSASDHIWTCDFSYDYVRINGSYRS